MSQISLAEAWGPTSQARIQAQKKSCEIAIEENLALQVNSSTWGFCGRRETVANYSGSLRLPVVDFLQKVLRFKKAIGDNTPLRIIDAFTSHTDPLVGVSKGDYEDKGLPKNAISGFSFGLTYMGSERERREAQAKSVIFHSQDVFTRTYELFSAIDKWRTLQKDQQFISQPIDAMICRLGIGDVAFLHITPSMYHYLLGEFYRRLNPNFSVMIFQVPGRIDDNLLQKYINVLQQYYGLKIMQVSGIKTIDEVVFGDDAEHIYGRSIALWRKSESTSSWPKLRQIRRYMDEQA